LIRTAEAARVLNPIIRLLAVDLKEIYSDLPQLQIEAVKAGKGRNGVQRFKMPAMREALSETQHKPFGGGCAAPTKTVCRILHCLVEGNSVRGTARLCDVEKAHGS